MNYGEIRDKFVDLSGRQDLPTDLTTTPYTDGNSSVEFFIHNGQRFLDNHQIHPKSYLRYQKDVSIGAYFLEFKEALAIKEVWYTKPDARKILIKKPLGWLKENYSYPFADITDGDPTYFAINIIGLMGQQDALTSANYSTEFTEEYQDIHFGDEDSSTSHQLLRGILIMPPPETAGTITVVGQFQSKTLSADADENFWTVKYPDLLIQASMYSLESFYRNTEGAKDWKNVIEETLRGIDYNLVEEESTGAFQLVEELEYINLLEDIDG